MHQKWFLLILVCYVAQTAKYLIYSLKSADVTQIWWRHLCKHLQILAKFFTQTYNISQCFLSNVYKRFFLFFHVLTFFTGRQRSCKPCNSYRREPSVCLSVCLSVTRWHWVKTTRARITKSSPSDSPTLVFGFKNSSRNSTGVTPSEGIKWEWGRKNSQFSANNSPYLRNGAR